MQWDWWFVDLSWLPPPFAPHFLCLAVSTNPHFHCFASFFCVGSLDDLTFIVLISPFWRFLTFIAFLFFFVSCFFFFSLCSSSHNERRERRRERRERRERRRRTNAMKLNKHQNGKAMRMRKHQNGKALYFNWGIVKRRSDTMGLMVVDRRRLPYVGAVWCWKACQMGATRTASPV